MDPNLNTFSDTLISFGGEIKSVEETATGYQFGGWLVVFDKPDVSSLRDRFTKSTDFDIQDGDRRSLYYNHGLDGTIKKEKLGDCRLTVKDAGVWIQGEIKKRHDYLAKHAEHIAQNIKQFGLSSGAPAHLVERVKVGGGHEVKLWPLAEASITPTPAEPLTGCFSLKSLAAYEAAEGLADLPEANTPNSKNPLRLRASAVPEIQNLEDSLPDGLTFQAHSQKVLAANGELLHRIESLADCRCVKSNRRWSAEKYGLLMGTATNLIQVADSIKALAQTHAPRTGNEPDAAALLAQIELTRARLNGVAV